MQDEVDGLTQKSRVLPFSGNIGTFRQQVFRQNGFPWSDELQFDRSFNFPSSLQGSQVTVSESHPSWRLVKDVDKTYAGDIGGSFRTQKSYVDGETPLRHYEGREELGTQFYLITTYDGPVTPFSFAGVSFPAADSSPDWALDAVGATAIARCKPTNSIADLSTFLGELKAEGLPRLIGASTWRSKAKKATKLPGSEYLNVEFGWKPLVSDVRAIAQAIAFATTVLKQYERDSGKVVRRRYEFPTKEEYSEELISINQRARTWPGSSSLQSEFPPLGKVMCLKYRRTDQWFSGAFQYHLPSGYDARNRMDRIALKAKTSLGLTLTPDVLWNLAPWSWAVDWFSNLGDVIDNASDWASDGLVMKYGYVMEHKFFSDTYIFDGPTGLKSGLAPAPLTLVTETKVRRQANPFGFGLNWDGLTPRQLAIAASLGINRTKH